MIRIKTYQDLLRVGSIEKDRMEFILSAISEHKNSEMYRIAADAELYYKHQNPTIMRFQKFVYNRFGQKVPNVWSANNKIASNWYKYFTTQAVSFLLGNGVTFKDDANKQRLGRDFDKKLQKLATSAKNGGVGFGFWNYDHVEVFNLTEFAPLYDEEDGALKAGIRFWQIDDQKPLRITLYELDGYTEYVQRKGEEMTVSVQKRAYRETAKSTKAEGVIDRKSENFSSLPIVPLWNVNKQSDLVGNRGTLDAYDLMISGLINNVSDGEFLYWILTNCNGMSDDEVCQFIEGLTVHHVAKAGNGDEGSRVDAHKAEVPFEASAESLDRLKQQLFADFMALDVHGISAGNKTATEIEAAYEPLNQKTDEFELCVTEFIQCILSLAGIDDEPTYTRSQLANQTETAELVLQCAEYLDEEYITTKLLTLLGDADKVEEVMKRKIAETAERYKEVGTDVDTK